MTKLPSAVDICNATENNIHEKDSTSWSQHSLDTNTPNTINGLKHIEDHGSQQTNLQNSENTNDEYNEPLGYQSFLYDVNIEYSPGGSRGSTCNKYCFKMKCLPYMVECDKSDHLSPGNSTIDTDDTSSEMIDCGDRNSTDFNCNSSIDDYHDCDSFESFKRTTPIDVTKETCAFLGNYDYVPNTKFKTRKVILELVSAKLSQSNGYSIPPNSSFSNLITLNEDSSQLISSTTSTGSDTSSLRSNNSHSSAGLAQSDPRGGQVRIRTPLKSAPYTPPPQTSPSSSRKFVNYTILIKTVPGLDKYPAVIERRFSDFLTLYQGLRSRDSYSEIVDRNVTFPKKVYMGNFSLEKIAERSIEFTRLLHLCLSEQALLWSIPFISFLIDKELKEAHRLSLIGDPDDVQALIENAFYVEQKLYLKIEQSPSCNSSTDSLDLLISQNGLNCLPTLPNARSTSINDYAPTTISAQCENGFAVNDELAQQHQLRHNNRKPTVHVSSSDGLNRSTGIKPHVDKSILVPLNQRILVTFCMLFVAYCRNNNYRKLKHVICKFSRLLLSQEFVDSLIDTRHFNSLRACLIFLVNMTQVDVIDDNLRQRLRRRLEDIDEFNSVRANEKPNRNSDAQNQTNRSSHLPNMDEGGRASTRITKQDLTSLIRDRNFCLFQDGKFI